MIKTTESILSSFPGIIWPMPGAPEIKNKHTALRAAQLEKIKICNRFTDAFTRTGFFNKTFPAYSNVCIGYNRATSVLLSQGLIGNYPAIRLCYPNVLISKGKLPAAMHAAAVAMTDGNIYFSFTNNSDMGSASESDKIILVAYAEALHYAEVSLHAGYRKDCEAILHTSALKGCVVETWIGFLSSDEMDASNSVYTGRVRL